MAHNKRQTLALVKARLNRAPSDTTLDLYLKARIQAADEEAKAIGIHLEENSVEDMLYLVDVVVWQYQNRDHQTGMPQWMRLRRNERLLQQIHRGDSG